MHVLINKNVDINIKNVILQVIIFWFSIYNRNQQLGCKGLIPVHIDVVKFINVHTIYFNLSYDIQLHILLNLETNLVHLLFTNYNQLL